MPSSATGRPTSIGLSCLSSSSRLTGADLTPERLRGLDAVVIGISKDSVASHDKFKKKHGLPFILASDTGGDVCEKYGVWVEKSMYGRKYMGIERATFLIDGTGVIRGVWHKVRVPGHVGEVLKAARAL